MGPRTTELDLSCHCTIFWTLPKGPHVIRTRFQMFLKKVSCQPSLTKLCCLECYMMWSLCCLDTGLVTLWTNLLTSDVTYRVTKTMKRTERVKVMGRMTDWHHFLSLLKCPPTSYKHTVLSIQTLIRKNRQTLTLSYKSRAMDSIIPAISTVYSLRNHQLSNCLYTVALYYNIDLPGISTRQIAVL